MLNMSQYLYVILYLIVHFLYLIFYIYTDNILLSNKLNGLTMGFHLGKATGTQSPASFTYTYNG